MAQPRAILKQSRHTRRRATLVLRGASPAAMARPPRKMAKRPLKSPFLSEQTGIGAVLALSVKA